MPDFRGKARALQARGGRLVVVDPRRTETARLADRHLFIRPGSDVFFLLGLAHTLFDEGLVRLGALAEHVNGVEAVREALVPFVPERVAARCGIAAEEAVAAFRYMAQARHVGKIVLRNRPAPALAIRPDATYLITGGLGALGLAVARSLVEQGARHLALLGRSAPGPQAAAVLTEVAARGAAVHTLRCDVADRAAVAAALARIAEGPWIGVGGGRGIGLYFVLLGFLQVLLVAAASRYRPLRRLEAEIPDAIDDTAPDKAVVADALS